MEDCLTAFDILHAKVGGRINETYQPAAGFYELARNQSNQRTLDRSHTSKPRYLPATSSTFRDWCHSASRSPQTGAFSVNPQRRFRSSVAARSAFEDVSFPFQRSFNARNVPGSVSSGYVSKSINHISHDFQHKPPPPAKPMTLPSRKTFLRYLLKYADRPETPEKLVLRLHQQFSIPLERAQQYITNNIAAAKASIDDISLEYDVVQAWSKKPRYKRLDPLCEDYMIRVLALLPEVGQPAPLDAIALLARNFAPSLRYTDARGLQRRLVAHVGPTNSGKTYNALVALSKARSGIYAGPLRLLAHEVYARFNSGDIAGLQQPRECNLITGEERRMKSPFCALSSCTVEMVPLTKRMDVAVVDEIQMIADPIRGPAWTTALLALPAREIHLCGESTALPILEKIARETGEPLEIRRYERLSPLITSPSICHDLNQVRKGDALVAFSRTAIFDLKSKLEKINPGMRVAVVYGGLPPETRSEQAALFNDPDNQWDVLVGSDAIGLGLNL